MVDGAIKAKHAKANSNTSCAFETLFPLNGTANVPVYWKTISVPSKIHTLYDSVHAVKCH